MGEWGAPSEIVIKNPAPIGTVQLDQSDLALASLGERLHGSLTGVSANQHHTKSHAHDGADGSGTVSYNDLTDVPASGQFHIVFTETALSGTYSSAPMVIPAGAIVDATVLGITPWGAETSALFDLVDTAGAHVFPTPLDLRTHPASPPAAIFPDYHDGGFHATHAAMYYPAGTTFTATVTTVSVAGAAGVTHLVLSWELVDVGVDAVKS